MDRDKKWLLVEGNPVDGFTYTGPFDSHEDAVNEAENGADHDGDWWIAPMLRPA